MHSSAVSRSSNHLLTVLGVGILVFIMALYAPVSAHAHDQLVETNPQADAQLTTAPSQIELTYNNSLIEVGNIVEVLNATGDNVVEQELVVSGPKLIQPLSADLPDGWYLVNWRAVSSDGHPITGHFYYLVGDDASLPKPAENPEFSDDHHHDAESEEAATDTGPNLLLLSSLMVGGIGVGLAIYYLAMRKKKNSE